VLLLWSTDRTTTTLRPVVVVVVVVVLAAVVVVAVTLVVDCERSFALTVTHTHARTDRRTSLIHTHADELPQLSGGVGRSYTHTHTHIPLKLLAKTQVNLSSGL